MDKYNNRDLILGDVFHEVFKTKYNISESDVNEAYYNPNKVQNLKFGLKLFIKCFDKNESRRKFLLLSTFDENGIIGLGFAFWLPLDLIDLKLEILEMLKKFVDRFGIKIRIGLMENKYIEYERVFLNHKLKGPYDLVQVLCDVNIPCQTTWYVSYEKEMTDYFIYDVNYAFSINDNKYLMWYNQIPLVEIVVSQEWGTLLSDVIEVLEPNGKTELNILRPQHAVVQINENSKNKEKIVLKLPEKYEPKFKHIVKLLDSLRANEKVLIIPLLYKRTCLFCDSENLSDEHILSKWLRPYFEEQIFDSVTHFRTERNEELLEVLKSGVTKGHKESSYGYTVKLVCEQCNTTWMSNLENKVKDILLDQDLSLVKQLDISSLNQNKCFLLSSWLLKIALLLSNKVIVHLHNIPKQMYYDLKLGLLPKDLIVEYATSPTYGLNFLVNKGLNGLFGYKPDKTPLEIAKNDLINFFMLSIQIGYHLFRLSLLNTNEDYQRITDIRKTEVIYPFRGKIVYQDSEIGRITWAGGVKDKLILPIFNLGMIVTR